jgi:ribosomal protein S18 acetylase RimI-like enzyme
MSAENNSGLLRLAETDVPQIVNVLTQAFHDDPVWSAVLPDPDQRRKALTRLFRINVGFAALHGQIFAPSNNLEGAAVWLPPGKSLNTVDALRLGWRDLWATLLISGFQGFGRVMQVVNAVETRQRQDAPKTPYWYLMQIGVLPHYQHQGFGSRLLKPMLERFDHQRELCYLETETPANVAFYEKRGFKVVTEARISTTDLKLWTMVRHPQDTAAKTQQR